MQSVNASAGPLFATVCFVCENGGVEHQTFRVPIDPQTTVKHLAKSAMWRLQQLQKVSQFGIREILVGAGSNDSVKLFIHDVVVQVVNVREEKVFLVLRDKAASHTQPLPLHSVELKSPSPQMSSEHQLHLQVLQQRRRSKSPAVERCDRKTSDSPAAAIPEQPAQQPVRRVLVARSMPVPVAVTSPNPISKSASHKSPEKRPREEAKPVDRVLTPEAAKVCDLTKMNEADRERFIKQKGARDGYGWGKDAHRLFESNYTSDPDKLARELRKGRKAGTVKKNAVDCDSIMESCSSAAVRTVPKSLLPSNNPSLSRADPVGPDPSRQLLAELQSAEDDDSQRPSGWGVKASSYFDPRTYHDNPSKARLDPELLEGPIRARRHHQLHATS